MPQQGSSVPHNANQYYNSFSHSNLYSRTNTHCDSGALPFPHISPPNTGLTPHTVGVCRPRSDSQKNIMWNVSFLFLFYDSQEFSGCEWRDNQFQTQREMNGKDFFPPFFGKNRHACTRSHAAHTQNENHIISRKSSL